MKLVDVLLIAIFALLAGIAYAHSQETEPSQSEAWNELVRDIKENQNEFLNVTPEQCDEMRALREKYPDDAFVWNRALIQYRCK